jgi:hypothetical protein
MLVFIADESANKELEKIDKKIIKTDDKYTYYRINEFDMIDHIATKISDIKIWNCALTDLKNLYMCKSKRYSQLSLQNIYTNKINCGKKAITTYNEFIKEYKNLPPQIQKLLLKYSKIPPIFTIDNYNFELIIKEDMARHFLLVKITNLTSDKSIYATYYRSQSEGYMWRLGVFKGNVLYKGSHDYVQQTFVHFELQIFFNLYYDFIPDNIKSSLTILNSTLLNNNSDIIGHINDSKRKRDVFNDLLPECGTKNNTKQSVQQIAQLMSNRFKIIENPKLVYKNYNNTYKINKDGHLRISKDEDYNMGLMNITQTINLSGNIYYIIIENKRNSLEQLKLYFYNYNYSGHVSNILTINNKFSSENNKNIRRKFINSLKGSSKYKIIVESDLVTKIIYEKKNKSRNDKFIPLLLTPVNATITNYGLYSQYVYVGSYICKIFDYYNHVNKTYNSKSETSTNIYLLKEKSGKYSYIGDYYNDIFPFNLINKNGKWKENIQNVDA